MAYDQRSLDDYVDVATRIADFRKKHPEGSRRGDWMLVHIDDQHYICYNARAYRTPDDPAPGGGSAWELVPGRTPYTRGSELQNAETSAWGRAIIACGASDSKRGVASREDVQWRQAERDTHINPPCPVCGSPYPDCGHRNADGSLSRSRTTDDEKTAAGVMTAAEQKAHLKLAKPPPNTQPVDSLSTGKSGFAVPAELAPYLVPGGGDDRWTSDAPSWAVGVDPPEDEPGSILPAQRSQIMAVYTALGIKDRDDRIADVQKVLGVVLPSGSTNDLSHQQAGRLLENLHERHTGKMTRR
jgi:hypothetical protein